MGPLRGTTAAFFDLYNTLARFQPPGEEVQCEACQRLGIAVSPASVATGYLAADAFMARENARRSVRSRPRAERRAFFVEYERLVLQGAGVAAGPELAARVWDEVRRIPYHLALFDDAVPALAALRGMGLSLGVLSNVDQGSGELLDSLGLGTHVDFLITSREVGADKPHPAMFLEALARAGSVPERAVHVGDQVASDVEGARGVGIRPVLLLRSGPSEAAVRDGVPQGVPVVRSLLELPALLA